MDNHTPAQARKLRRQPIITPGKPVLQQAQSTESQETDTLKDKVKLNGFGVKVDVGEIEREGKPPIKFKLKFGSQDREKRKYKRKNEKSYAPESFGAGLKINF